MTNIRRSLITDCEIMAGMPKRTGEKIPTAVKWESEVPFQVAFAFSDPKDSGDAIWFLNRDLIIAAYANPGTAWGEGDVQCGVGSDGFVLRLIAAPVSVIFKFEPTALADFIEETLLTVPVTEEEADSCIDGLINDILNEAGA